MLCIRVVKLKFSRILVSNLKTGFGGIGYDG